MYYSVFFFCSFFILIVNFEFKVRELVLYSNDVIKREIEDLESCIVVDKKWFLRFLMKKE